MSNVRFSVSAEALEVFGANAFQSFPMFVEFKFGNRTIPMTHRAAVQCNRTLRKVSARGLDHLVEDCLLYFVATGKWRPPAIASMAAARWRQRGLERRLSAGSGPSVARSRL